ncbi:hypothetical protein EVAR_94985_1 [Eumeta japonica]|uniref:Uncharacterized protein n=1 Tax=Eumeta variegata TaxID=151549 RepID=A0A4C1UV77_EUMVA|nr:hypothetical protein EVAR_94985_1 [Eumeta japonica]
MVAVFFAKRGILSKIGFDKGKTITAARYTKECLPRVLEGIKSERSNSGTVKTMEHLHKAGIELMRPPPCRPDLGPCDFTPFDVGTIGQTLFRRRDPRMNLETTTTIKKCAIGGSRQQ